MVKSKGHGFDFLSSLFSNIIMFDLTRWHDHVTQFWVDFCFVIPLWKTQWVYQALDTGQTNYPGQAYVFWFWIQIRHEELSSIFQKSPGKSSWVWNSFQDMGGGERRSNGSFTGNSSESTRYPVHHRVS